MKRIISVFMLSICWMIAHGQNQTIVRKVAVTNDGTMGLDTNKMAIDEQGNRLHFYQYRSLLTSGQYGISSIGPNGPLLNEYRLIKRDDNQTLQLYEIVKKQIAIKSTMLEEGNKLSVIPLRTIDPAKFDNKAIVLMFLSPDCEQCMADIPDISSFLKQVDPRKVVLVALARGDESPERMKYLQSLLPNTYIFINYVSISEAYWANDLTTGYVITDKDHIIRFTAAGQGGMIRTVFKNKLTEVLK